MKKPKRLLALVLCAILLIGSVPVRALADDTVSALGTADNTAVSEGGTSTNSAESDVVKVEKTGDNTIYYYTTLQNAFDAHFKYDSALNNKEKAMGGTYTVTLLADCDRAEISAKTDSYIAESFNITLDLNGHSIISSDSTKSVLNITIGSSTYPSIFTVTDSVGGGKITGGKWGIVFGGAQATLNFNGGTITGNHGGTTGGGICASSTTNQPVINLNGGVITGNSVTGTSSANTGLGGGVYACQINLNGTIITGNYAYGGTGKYTGRGGGIATPITGTHKTGYMWNVVNINTNTVYGNYADNAGDDLMIAKNGNTYHDLSLPTSNWYIDGWNGKSQSVGETDRYSAENPVAYTDGGFTYQKTINLGLKYVAPVVEDTAPAAPEILDDVNDNIYVFRFVCEDGVEGHNNLSYAWFGSNNEPQWREVSEVTKDEATGKWVCEVTFHMDYCLANVTQAVIKDHEVVSGPTGDVTITMAYNMETGKWEYTGETIEYVMSCQPNYVAKVESTGVEYLTLQEALDAAKAVLEGDAETEKITLLRNTTENVKLSWSRKNGTMTLTIDLNGYTVTGDGTSSVMTFSGLTSYNGRFNIVIDDSSENETGTVTGGNASFGGAIKMDGAKSGDSLTINGGNFVNNSAKSGGAIYCSTVGAKVTVNGGTFTNNTATAGSGGAIAAYTVVVNDGTFTGNYALGTDSFTGRGGAICLWGSGALSLTVNGGAIYGNNASRYGDDIVFCTTNGTTASMQLVDASKMNANGVNAWCVDGYYGAYGSEANMTDRYFAETAVEFADYANFGGSSAKGIAVALKAGYVDKTPDAPEADGSNVTDELIKIVCDDHASATYGWHFNGATVMGEVTWNETLSAWTVDVRVGSLFAYYVNAFYNSTAGMYHSVVGDDYINITLKWDDASAKWVTSDGKPVEVEVACVATPDAPDFSDFGSYYKVKVTNEDESLVYNVSLYRPTVTIGEVKGNRTDGFTIDITVAIEDNDKYITTWAEWKNVTVGTEINEYSYDWDKNETSYTFTLTYTGDLNADFKYQDVTGLWQLATDEGYVTTGSVCTVYTKINTTPKPEAPDKYGKNVTDELVKIICDTDDDHEPATYGWLFQSAKVRTWVSDVVWSVEDETWIVPIRLDSISTYYVYFQYRIDNNKISHDLVPDAPIPEGEYHIDTYLKWDEEQRMWVTMDGKPIEIHVSCKTEPTAPSNLMIGRYQIKVNGVVDGEAKVYYIYVDTTTATIGEIQGSREEGFTVDVTVKITEDDAYQSGWLAQRDPDATVADYVYNWDKTPETITFTLKYTGDLEGNLGGTSSGDWVLSTTGKTFGTVGEVWMIPTEPAKPVQGNVTTELVTIICDTDADHETVYGKWYPQNCDAKSEPVWNEELNAWTIDVRIDSIDWYYVHMTLERAYNNIHHDLVSSNYVDTVLKWDTAQNLWVPTETIEVHATCKTVPDAPVYKNQLDDYQIKVWGDVNGELKAYTTTIPENGYTISEVYGSREEGFFVDVTVTLSEGDIYQTNWIAKKNPGYFYTYDWSKTEKTFTFTLKYNGSLTGTLYGDRYASNTNIDWVLVTTGKDYGVVSEAYLDQVKCTVNVVIYRNGDTTTPYKTISLGKIAKGATLDLTSLNIADYYTSTYGYEFEGWFNDGRWNQYKAGSNPTGLDEIYINGWTNLICMVTDYQKVVVKAVTNGDKDNAVTIFDGKALKGTNLLEWLEANVDVAEKTGYTLDKWYNWDWYGHKYDSSRTINGWTNVYVTYTAHTYTIKYNGGEGSYIGSEPNSGDNWMLIKNGYTYDAPVTLDDGAGFVRTGYTLVGWKIGDVVYKPGETVEKNFTDVQSGTVQAYAVWEANSYTLTLDANGGTVAPDSLTVIYDAAISEMPVPIRTGYTFAGWFDAEGNEVTAATIYTVAGDSTLTANWTANQYTVTLNANGGECASATLTVTYDAAVGELPVPTKTGYTFIGWLDANGNKVIAETVYTVAGDSTWTAEWSANAYNITLDANGGEVDPAEVNVVYGQAVNTLPVPTKTGYTFGGWYDANGNEVTAETIYAVAGDITLTAKWTANKYTVTLDANGGTVAPDSLTVIYDAAVSEMPVPIRTGYTFAGWYDANGNEVIAATVYTVAGDSTLTAQWIANKYTVTLDDGSEETSTIEVTYDAAIGELPVPTKEGYTFAGWFDAEGNEVTAETVYTVAGDSTLTAKWNVNKYTVTLDDGSEETTTIEVTYGEAIGELPTPVKEGYTFEGWVDAEGNKVTAETVYTCTADSTYTAVWSIIPQTGDNTMIAFAAVMMLLAAAAVLYLADRQRKMAR